MCRGNPLTTPAGTEIFVGNLAKELTRQGHSVDLVYGEDEVREIEGRSRVDGLTIHSVKTSGVPYIRALDFRRKSSSLVCSLISESDIDAAVVFGAGTFGGYIFSRIRKLENRPLLLYYAMDSMVMEYKRSKSSIESGALMGKLSSYIWYSILERCDRQSCTESDAVLASSNDAANHFVADYGVPDYRIKTLYAGVPDYFAREIVTTDPDVPTFLHVASGARKGTGSLVDALRLLERKYGLRAKAVIVRPSKSQIEELEESGIDAEIHGPIPQSELKLRYASCTAFVSPSLSEGFCLPLVEAAMFGKPAIVTDVGSQPEIVIDGESGFVVPPFNTDSLADKMYQVAVNKDLRMKMGERARGRSSDFAISETVMSLLDWINKQKRHSAS